MRARRLHPSIRTSHPAGLLPGQTGHNFLHAVRSANAAVARVLASGGTRTRPCVLPCRSPPGGCVPAAAPGVGQSSPAAPVRRRRGSHHEEGSARGRAHHGGRSHLHAAGPWGHRRKRHVRRDLLGGGRSRDLGGGRSRDLGGGRSRDCAGRPGDDWTDHPAKARATGRARGRSAAPRHRWSPSSSGGQRGRWRCLPIAGRLRYQRSARRGRPARSTSAGLLGY